MKFDLFGKTFEIWLLRSKPEGAIDFHFCFYNKEFHIENIQHLLNNEANK